MVSTILPLPTGLIPAEHLHPRPVLDAFTPAQCARGCCHIHTRQVPPYRRPFCWKAEKRPRAGAGIFIFNSVTGRVLLTQSYAGKYGPAKGMVELHERDDHMHAAWRETLEETGIDVSRDLLQELPCFRIKRVTLYFLDTALYPAYESLIHDEQRLAGIEQDISAVGWISIDCLDGLGIELNHHGKVCLRMVFRYDVDNGL